MPEIKNQRAFAKVAQYIIDLSIKSCTAGQKRDWIGRHKHVCAETKRMMTQEDKARYFLQMLEDPNMRAVLGKRNK